MDRRYARPVESADRRGRRLRHEHRHSPAAPPSPSSATSSPRSPDRGRWRSWPARRQYVADGVGTTLPVFVEAAGGGVLLDADGNSLIDLGSGIAVTTVGNAAPEVVRRVQEQVAAFTHTCFMVTPYDGYVDVCERARRAHAGRPREEVGAVQLRRRGRRERRQDRPRGDRQGRRRGLRPRLPRPHQPDDGDDRQEHALQERLRPVRRRGLPRADVLPVPRDRRDQGRGRGGARDRPAREAGRRGEPRLRRDRADPGRGRLRRARRRASCRRSPPGAATTASCSSPTRSSPASAAPATGSPATTRASCPT